MEISTSRNTLFKLALPLLLETILKNLMSTVNVFMLSSYSDAASAAAGVANQIINVAIITFSSIASGAVIIVNQQLGAGKNREAAKTSMNALSIAVLLGLVVSIVLTVFAKQFLLAMGLQPELINYAMTYLRGVGSICVIFSSSYIMSALFRCHNNTRTPMFVVAITNIINIVGAWIVVFRPFEQPLEGVVGIVVVRVISEIVGVVILIAALVKSNYGFVLRDLFHFNVKTLFKTVKLSLMVSCEGLSYSLGQVITTSLLTVFGTVALSAKIYVQTVTAFTYMCGMAIGQATQIITGHLIGAGRFDDAYHNVWRGWRLTLCFNVLFSVTLYIFYKPLIGLFTSDPEIIKIAQTLMLIDIATNAIRSFNHSTNFGLVSAGYTFVPMLLAIGSIWALNVGVGWLTSTILGMGIVGLWIGQLTDETFRGIFQAFLWRSRRWEKASIIKHT